MQDQVGIDEDIKAAQAEVEAAKKAYSEAQVRFSEATEAASKAEILCTRAYVDWTNSLFRRHKLTTGGESIKPRDP
jgi:hypothetical protein